MFLWLKNNFAKLNKTVLFERIQMGYKEPYRQVQKGYKSKNTIIAKLMKVNTKLLFLNAAKAKLAARCFTVIKKQEPFIKLDY